MNEMSDKILCPYCAAECENDDDDLYDGEIIEIEKCHECGKAFRYTIHCAVSYESYKSCEANGLECQLIPIPHETNRVGYTLHECTVCGDWRRKYNIVP